MNCFSGCHDRRKCAGILPVALLRRLVFFLLVAPVMACGGPSSETPDDDTPPVYEIVYRASPEPSQGGVTVELELRQSQSLLRQVRFRAPGSRFNDFAGDGSIERDGDVLIWSPLQQGGKLRWQVSVPHRRNGKGYDAWLGESWGLFRAEDIIPGAATRTVKAARSVTSLEFDLPSD